MKKCNLSDSAESVAMKSTEVLTYMIPSIVFLLLIHEYFQRFLRQEGMELLIIFPDKYNEF